MSFREKLIKENGFNTEWDIKDVNEMSKKGIENILLRDAKETFAECLTLMTAKNVDYGQQDVDVYANFRKSLVVGVDPKKAILVRIMDKVSRISTLIDNNGVSHVDEKLDETINDVINYFAILKSFNAHG